MYYFCSYYLLFCKESFCWWITVDHLRKFS